jgi:hypothetical protein
LFIEMAGETESCHEIHVLTIHREPLQPVVTAIGDHENRVADRVSAQMPCGSASLPGSDPLPPKVRM